MHLRKQPAECKDSFLGGRKYLQARFLERSCHSEYSHGSPLLGRTADETPRLVGAGQGRSADRPAWPERVGIPGSGPPRTPDSPPGGAQTPQPDCRECLATVTTPHPRAPSLLSVPRAGTSGWHDQPSWFHLGSCDRGSPLVPGKWLLPLSLDHPRSESGAQFCSAVAINVY